MNRKIKLAIIAMLGFSTACTAVKNAPKNKERSGASQGSDTVPAEIPRRVVVMYGVPAPLLDSVQAEHKRRDMERPDTLPPVAERPQEDDPQLERD